MPRTIRHRVMVAAMTAILAFSAQTINPASGTASAVTATTTADTIYEWDLENEPSQCIGLLPHPDCGRAPTQAGDRGGVLQFTVFGLIVLALCVIGGVIVRNVVRRDRAIAAAMRQGPPPDGDPPR